MLLTEQELLERIDDLVKVSRSFAQQKLTNKSRLRLEKSMERMFKTQQKIVLKHLAKYRDMFEEALSMADLESIMMIAEGKSQQVAEGAIEQAIKDGLINGAKAFISEIRLLMKFDLANPAAVDYLERFGAKKVTQINNSTRKYINSIVKQSADEGWSYSRTAKAIGERYKDMWVGKPQQHIASRAHFIAVTEVGNAYMEGQLAVGHELMAAGLPMEKYWSTMRDDRVSDGCIENEGKGWIDLAFAFPSGHMRPLRFPGCRCDLLQRVSEKAKVEVPERLEGYQWDYGIDPKWTDTQRMQFIEQNWKFNIRQDYQYATRSVKLGKYTSLEVEARERALSSLARQPDRVVGSFLKRGEIILAQDDAAFARLYGMSEDALKNVSAYFDPGKNRMVFRLVDGDRSVFGKFFEETFDHEMGHFVHKFAQKQGGLFTRLYGTYKSFDRFTEYSRKSYVEGFAESYTAWMKSTNRLALLGKEFAAVEKNFLDKAVLEIFKIIEKASETTRR